MDLSRDFFAISCPRHFLTVGCPHKRFSMSKHTNCALLVLLHRFTVHVMAIIELCLSGSKTPGGSAFPFEQVTRRLGKERAPPCEFARRKRNDE